MKQFLSTGRQRFTLLVVLLLLFSGYSFFLYGSLPVKKKINDKASAGKLVWQRYNCNACHQLYGLGGFLGPDLTNSYSKRGADYIKAFVRSGTGQMPAFKFSEQELNDLEAFLKDADSSGSSDPKKFTLNYDGTIQQ